MDLLVGFSFFGVFQVLELLVEKVLGIGKEKKETSLEMRVQVPM